MVRITQKGELIRQFILNNIREHPKDIAHFTANKFGISRQAVNKHLKILIDQNAIESKGATNNHVYSISVIKQNRKTYDLNGSLQEDVVWRNDIAPSIIQYPDNVKEIWHYCFTEILNNAIDHSSGSNVLIEITKTAIDTEIMIYDNGEGIFRKIQRELNLLDERHAILELQKGKLTTDPKNHTGEGIFFSSRLMDNFNILSSGTYYSHNFENDDDWILEREVYENGTGVFMKLRNNTSKSIKKIFEEYASKKEDYGFNKTIVPVKLAQYGEETLISRSQAKRLLARLDRFKTVILDFKEVNHIGQAFADEIFRVFKNQNQGTNIIHINANEEVESMIVRAS